MKVILKRISTSKIILYGGNFLCDIIIGIILYGWLNGSMDASYMLTDIIIVKGVIYFCYYGKAAIENYSKGQMQIKDLPLSKINNIITMFQGVLNAFMSGNMASAGNSVISSLQQVIQNEQMQQQNNMNEVMPNNDNSINSLMGQENVQEDNAKSEGSVK